MIILLAFVLPSLVVLVSYFVLSWQFQLLNLFMLNVLTYWGLARNVFARWRSCLPLMLSMCLKRNDSYWRYIFTHFLPDSST